MRKRRADEKTGKNRRKAAFCAVFCRVRLPEGGGEHFGIIVRQFVILYKKNQNKDGILTEAKLREETSKKGLQKVTKRLQFEE